MDLSMLLCTIFLLLVLIHSMIIFAEPLVLYGQVRNEKARRYLSSMRKKKPIPFSQKFPNADPLALCLLERMLAFEPKDRPTAEEVKYLCLFILLFTIYILFWGDILCSCCQALADPYFKGLAKVEREPSAQPVTKMEFEFERRRITKEDVRELIYREILEYHPKMLKEFLEGSEPTGFMYPRYSSLKFNTDFSTNLYLWPLKYGRLTLGYRVKICKLTHIFWSQKPISYIHVDARHGNFCWYSRFSLSWLIFLSDFANLWGDTFFYLM